jgi:hypothetical protein
LRPTNGKALREVPQPVSFAIATAGAIGLLGTAKEAFSPTAGLVGATKIDNPLHGWSVQAGILVNPG